MQSRKELLSNSTNSIRGVKSLFLLFVVIPTLFFVIFGPLSAEFAGKTYVAWVIANIIIVGCRLLARGLGEHSPFLEFLETRVDRISGIVAFSQKIGVITWGDHFVWHLLSEIFKIGNIFLFPNLLTLPLMYFFAKVLKSRISRKPEFFEENIETSESMVPSMLLPKLAFYAVAGAVLVGLAGGALLIGFAWYRKVLA
jgi:hypothetical protein